MKYLFNIVTVIFILTSQFLYSQDNEKEFFLDAVVFKSNESANARVDIYIVIPYEIIQFQNRSEKFISNFDLTIKLFDSENNKIDEKYKEKSLIVDNYKEAKGAEGGFYKHYASFKTSEGQFKVTAILEDQFSRKSFEKNREVSIIDYDKFDLSLSGILLLSQIEEVDGKFKITPHISDNVGSLEKDFFAFFEVYNRSEYDSIKVYHRIKQDNEVIKDGELKTIKLSGEREQNFTRIILEEKLKAGSYMLQVIALKPEAETKAEGNIIAVTQRSIKAESTLSDFIKEDIDEAIRKLKYAATSNEIDEMEEADSKEEKRRLFDQFWEERDPTPNTAKNEALEQYYSRIEYANKQFKSYTEGWMTDMGMVYIVLGPPREVEKNTSYGSGVEYRVWKYNNNRQFLFVDQNGFGDFRLERPYTFNEKYQYRR